MLPLELQNHFEQWRHLTSVVVCSRYTHLDYALWVVDAAVAERRQSRSCWQTSDSLARVLDAMAEVVAKSFPMLIIVIIAVAAVIDVRSSIDG